MPNIFFLTGNLHERKLALNKIKSQLSNCDIQTYNKDISYAYLEQAIYNDICFSDNRLIIINALPAATSTKATMLNHLKKTLENIPSNCFIVFNGLDDEKALLNFVNTLVAKKTAIVKDFPIVISKDEAPAWIQEFFSAEGKNISNEDAQLLVDINGFDPVAGGISVELLRISATKIMHYIGNRKKEITKEDVVNNSFPSEEFVLFRMFDAFDSKDYDRCVSAFHLMIQSQEGQAQPVKASIEWLLNASLPRYKMLTFIKEGLDKKLLKKEVIEETTSLYKLSSTGAYFRCKVGVEIIDTGENAGQKKMMFSEKNVTNSINGYWGGKPAIDKYNRRELIRILNCLQRCASEVRYRSGDASLMLLADVIFLTVCNKMDDKQLTKIRDTLWIN